MKLFNNFGFTPIRNRFDDERFGPTSVDEADDADDVFDDEDPIEEEVYEDGDDEPEDQMIPLSAVLKMQQSFAPQHQPAPAQQQAPVQLTKEEMEERLKVFRANEKHVQRLLNSEDPADQVAAINEIVNGIVTHLTTVSGYSNQIMLDQLSKQYAPALELVREREMSNFTKDITKAYPALKGYDPVIAQTIQFLKAQGFRPANGEEALRVVAGQVEALVKTANPQFSLARRPQRQQKQPTGGMPRMASLSGGSRGSAGGAGRQNNGGQKKAAYNDIWD